MDIKTWNSLTENEKAEVTAMTSDFIKAVFASSAIDGSDFGKKFDVRKIDQHYFLVEVSSGSILGDFKSESKNVMNALMTDAVQNYGR